MIDGYTISGSASDSMTCLTQDCDVTYSMRMGFFTPVNIFSRQKTSRSIVVEMVIQRDLWEMFKERTGLVTGELTVDSPKHIPKSCTDFTPQQTSTKPRALQERNTSWCQTVLHGQCRTEPVDEHHKARRSPLAPGHHP